MFDIGMPELLVIVVVALVVLGPEQLPEVMRKAGQVYRQFRELTTTYQAEARRFLEEGMREVETVSSTLTSTWQEATATAPASPPPKLRQVPPPLQAPDTVAHAGPWALAAWHRDTAADVEPYAAGYPQAPFVLPRRPLETGWLGGEWASLTGLGGPVLQAPAPAEVALGEPAERAALEVAMAGDLEGAELPAALQGQVPQPEPAPPVVGASLEAAAVPAPGPAAGPAGQLAAPAAAPRTNGAA